MTNTEALLVGSICENCPARKLSPDVCDKTDPTYVDHGSEYPDGQYVDWAVGTDVIVRISEQSLAKVGYEPDIHYLDRDKAALLTIAGNEALADCNGPTRRLPLWLEHCMGGIVFRAVSQREKEMNQALEDFLRRGSLGLALASTGRTTKFRSRASRIESLLPLDD